MFFENTSTNLTNYNVFDSTSNYYPQNDTNKILVVAYPLIVLAFKLKNKMFPWDSNNLKHKLIQEIKKFEEEIKKFDYSNQTVADARYIICDFIDELILQSDWAKEKDWAHNTLLAAVEEESSTNRGKYFFNVLKQALAEPAANLHLLELMYLLLNLGFEGKYRVQQKGKVTLSKITDDLYNCIDRYRIKLDQRSVINEKNVTASEVIKETKKNYFSLLIKIFVIISGCFLVYLNFNVKLNAMVAPIYKEIVSTSNLIN